MILPPSFFNQPVLDVAPQLLGKYLVRRMGRRIIALPITELEAYDGPHDLACHGRFGPTPRTQVMFGHAGNFYVYLIYGMYWMLNIVTGPVGYPAAILIRGVGHLDGPGKLTKHLKIDKQFDNQPNTSATGLWIEDRGLVIPSQQIITAPRIGVTYAGPMWSQVPYRFVAKI